MSEPIKLGDLVDLVSNVKQMTNMLDGAGDLEQLRKCLSSIVEDRKLLFKFMMALRRARRAADTLSETPLSFVGGFALPPEETTEPVPSYPERPVPRRAQRIAADPKARARVMGDDKPDDEGDGHL